jgi:hypothetical protein
MIINSGANFKIYVIMYMYIYVVTRNWPMKTGYLLLLMLSPDVSVFVCTEEDLI